MGGWIYLEDVTNWKNGGFTTLKMVGPYKTSSSCWLTSEWSTHKNWSDMELLTWSTHEVNQLVVVYGQVLELSIYRSVNET